MTVFGGDPVLAADINELIGRIATTILTADSSTWGAAEAQFTSITFAAIAGARYKIVFEGKISSDVSADTDNIRIREDNSTGNQLQLQQMYMPNTSGNGFQFHTYAEWTASATANKTIVMTGNRSSGTGTAHRVRASGAAPAYLYVDRIAD